MREILFRGKMIANGNWSEGNLLVTKRGCCITPDATVLGSYGAVDPETVGQYTGFKDKDGTKIFEGDIVEFDDTDNDNHGFYEVFWDGDNGKFAIAQNGNRNYVDDFELFERNEYFKWFTVIGNIFDNPELLEEENK